MRLRRRKARIGLAVAGLSFALSAPAAAQTLIGGYQAFIGPADLRNSRGAALTQPWQVIRQDRANVHRFGIRQPGDQTDPWFGSGEMRTALEAWTRNSGLDPALGAAIMAGNIVLYVEVLGQGGRATGVRIVAGGAAPGGGTPGGGDDPIITPE